MYPSSSDSDRNLFVKNRNAVSPFRRHTHIFLLCLALSSFGIACTENDDDDIQCGTPEMPCDGIVTDDMVEV